MPTSRKLERQSRLALELELQLLVQNQSVIRHMFYKTDFDKKYLFLLSE